jgi:hypothetical protein
VQAVRRRRSPRGRMTVGDAMATTALFEDALSRGLGLETDGRADQVSARKRTRRRDARDDRRDAHFRRGRELDLDRRACMLSVLLTVRTRSVRSARAWRRELARRSMDGTAVRNDLNVVARLELGAANAALVAMGHRLPWLNIYDYRATAEALRRWPPADTPRPLHLELDPGPPTGLSAADWIARHERRLAAAEVELARAAEVERRWRAARKAARE